MEWLLDPTAWVGLFTLVILEIVLGIDNLIFIAILADKLPSKQRDRARIMGLSLALVTRLVLLSVMSWLVTLTRPLLSFGSFSFSGRDLILMLGGLFLLFKGTVELHERLEGGEYADGLGKRIYPSFWVIVTQIVVLDAVFSIDSVITAIGMVEHLAIMMMAVAIAIGIMLVASKPLTRFVNAHPTVVVLCLGFLLMIGFSLLAESLGFKVPKGYLYAAIAFSAAIEGLNQMARRNLLRLDGTRPMRERTAETVLRMLGRRPLDVEPDDDVPPAAQAAQKAFGVEERNMVSGVLTLAERSIHSIMTPRTDITWINIEGDAAEIRRQLDDTPHSFFPVCRGVLDEIIGIGRAKNLVADLITQGHVSRGDLREPIIVHESTNILRLMDILKRSRGQLVLVADEFGMIAGLVTPIDVFEAIAGEFPDEDEMPDIAAEREGMWRIDGAADLHHVEQVLETDGLVDESQDYTTLAGYLLARFGQLPKAGDVCEYEAHNMRFRFEVLQIEGRRIASVQVEKSHIEPEEPGGDSHENLV